MHNGVMIVTVLQKVRHVMTPAERPAVSRKTVGRLSLYRRLLENLRASGTTNIYSHQLAHLAGVSPAQVRRDFMVIGYSGSPNRGYQVDTCLASIESLLDGAERQDVALVGLGRLGRSLLAHFTGKRPQLRIEAGFDTDPTLAGTFIESCPIYSLADMERVVAEKGIRIAILAVPPEVGQTVAETLVRAGVRSFVDFTGIPLRVPDEVFVDHMDITSALESAAFFARDENAAGLGEGGIEGGGEEAAGTGPEPAMFPIIRTIDALLAGANMRLDELAKKVDARVLTTGSSGSKEVAKIYAGDRVSDLLNDASDKTLLVTNLVNLQMLRVAELMDIPGICFVDGVDPDQEIIELADQRQILLMVSPLGVFETCGLIYQYLVSDQKDT
jgi:redox-sensing transcriptional repressor